MASEISRGHRPGNAALAQSVERLTRNEKVKGSIPLGGSNNGDWATAALFRRLLQWPSHDPL